MAKAKRNAVISKSKSSSSRSSGAPGNQQKGRSNGEMDAIALLKADHRQVEQWFEEFESARSTDKKRELAENICKALEVHTQIEEEIFYPAFLEATDDKDTHHEAELEHASAKQVIADIESSDPDDDYYDSRLKVLSEMIKHHVNEEEQPGGMFAEARKSSMDLQALGRAMKARKDELMMQKSSPRQSPSRGTQPSVR